MALINPPPSGKPEDTSAWRNWFNALFRIGHAVTSSGTTAQRPTKDLYPGRFYYDTDLDMPVWRNAANDDWHDATGTPA